MAGRGSGGRHRHTLDFYQGGAIGLANAFAGRAVQVLAVLLPLRHRWQPLEHVLF
jgi:hypothetical protein